jgi:hypothetical protein
VVFICCLQGRLELKFFDSYSKGEHLQPQSPQQHCTPGASKVMFP